MTCPVVLYWGANDWLTQPQVATLVHNHTDTQLVATKLNFELDCQVGCILHVIIIEHWPSLSKGCRCYCEPAARPSGIEEVNIFNHILIVNATSSTTVLALPTYWQGVNCWSGFRMKVSTTLTSSGPKTPTRFFTDPPWRWNKSIAHKSWLFHSGDVSSVVNMAALKIYRRIKSPTVTLLVILNRTTYNIPDVLTSLSLNLKVRIARKLFLNNSVFVEKLELRILCA